MNSITNILELVQNTKKFIKDNYSSDSVIYFERLVKTKNKKLKTLSKSGKSFDSANQKEINILSEKYKDCKNCQLYETRNSIVFGEGNPNSDLMIIGEAPGSNEDLNGVPFCGRAGDLLTKMLLAINIDRKDVYITNIIKCRPPQNRNPLADEIKNCSAILKKQIEIIKPKYILTLGNFAAQFILNQPKIGISKLRGTVHTINDYKVIPSYHPAFLLRSPGYKKEAWLDLQLLRDEMK
jgi:uracil-DNA glycosylase